MRILFLSLLSLLFTTPLIAQKPQNAQTQKQKQTVYEDYHTNGTVAQRGNLKNNKPDGIWSSYDSDGNLAMRGRYVEGKKEGTWLFWHADRLIQVEYKNNKKLSYFQFDYKDAYVEK